MHPDSYLHTHPSHAPTPAMSDVWLDHPVASHAPVVQHALMPVNIAPVQAQTDVLAGARPRPHADSIEWLFVKHLVQVALVASVVLLVLEGGRSPILALAYAATALLLMGTMVIADRQRFADRDPDFQIVEFFAPADVPAHHAAAAPIQVEYVQQHAPLAPLVEQMQGIMPTRVDVT